MNALQELLQTQRTRVQAILNLLLEAPYFYKQDDTDSFLFLRRHQREFAEFFEQAFGWQLTADAKCARLYKPEWFNPAITPANRDLFNFTRRDECIAFMLLLEFFEHKVDEESVSVDDPENLRFRFGDLLGFEQQRFAETFPEETESYTGEDVRRILRGVMPQLERYRFLLRIEPPPDETIGTDDTIYECLPAMWHYSVQTLARPVTLDAAEAEPARPESEG